MQVKGTHIPLELLCSITSPEDPSSHIPFMRLERNHYF